MHQSKVEWQQADSANSHNTNRYDAIRQNAKRRPENSYNAKRQHAKRAQQNTNNFRLQTPSFVPCVGTT